MTGRKGNRMKTETYKQYEMKQELLKMKFGVRYKRWSESNPQDDKALFCNLYRIYMEICEDMKTVENIHIKCAVNARLRDDWNTMGRISSRF